MQMLYALLTLLLAFLVIGNLYLLRNKSTFVVDIGKRGVKDKLTFWILFMLANILAIAVVIIITISVLGYMVLNLILNQ